MDEFYKYIKNNEDNIKSNIAYKEVINNLMQKQLTNSAKFDDYINCYDSETLFNGKLYRGNIYIFEYTANKPITYTYKSETIQFYDSMPIILMTGETKNCIRGINFNFCNKALKTIILNLFQNLDLEFYQGGKAQSLAFNKKLTISEKVYNFLIDPNAEKNIQFYLQQAYENVNYNFLYRNYNISNIKNIRLIEPWQWKYIPFLDYEGSIKKDTLEVIQKITGIDKM